jgi:hypothetical protein
VTSRLADIGAASLGAADLLMIEDSTGLRVATPGELERAVEHIRTHPDDRSSWTSSSPGWTSPRA